MTTSKHLQNHSSDDLKGEPSAKPGQPIEGTPQNLPRIDEGMVSAVPDELRQAWADYMVNGFKNNEKMFKQTLNAFMKPYNITIYMYVVMFIVGILFFVVAAALGFQGNQPLLAIGFGGLSVVSFLTFFIHQPVQALEENLEFISWLGVAFNTYWTRLMYISNRGDVQAELKAATDDFSTMVERLIEKHANLRAKRSNEITQADSVTPKSKEQEV